MADTKISALNSLTKSTVATNDVLPIVDTGSTETKKITYQELIQPTDANFRIAGSSDSTKLVAFEVDGLTTATTRTLTVPDANTTIVGTDATQTLTNKTLTSPQVNFGSDANGDMIIRNGSGVTARLPIGTTDQILAVQSGLPTWIANPSASAASSTTAGIVELATTAETETGTDATRAVTPDSLHDMTTLAGAAWFLDEDNMSSDSATKVASQQSIKAYALSLLATTSGVSRGPASSSTQSITHGLGRTPQTILIQGVTLFGGGASSGSPGISFGTYNATGNRCTYVNGTTAGGATADGTSTTYAINLTKNTGGTEVIATGVIQNVGATTFDIVWTAGGDMSTTSSFIWNAS